METPSKTGLLVISRHAESEWNLLGKWTGLRDVDLTEKGQRESVQIGEALKDIQFDVVYTSEQKRTHQTLAGILKGSVHPDIPHHIHSEINERDYGDLTGKNKWEVLDEIGEQAFKGIRREWDYPVPSGETLKDVYARVVPFFVTEIMPQLKAGKHILLVAHGNSIRALIKYLEAIHEEQVAEIEMPFGQILLYQMSPDGTISQKEIRIIDSTPPKA
jgi:2,3-bisphosphoglycerate-dependent phosphoglycerate mutase